MNAQIRAAFATNGDNGRTTIEYTDAIFDKASENWSPMKVRTARSEELEDRVELANASSTTSRSGTTGAGVTASSTGSPLFERTNTITVA